MIWPGPADHEFNKDAGHHLYITTKVSSFDSKQIVSVGAILQAFLAPSLIWLVMCSCWGTSCLSFGLHFFFSCCVLVCLFWARCVGVGVLPFFFECPCDLVEDLQVIMILVLFHLHSVIIFISHVNITPLSVCVDETFEHMQSFGIWLSILLWDHNV